MNFSFFKGAVWQLVQQMDWLAILILIGLFCLSVLCVAIIAFKYNTFRTQRLLLQNLLQRLKHMKNFSEIISVGQELKDSLGGKFLMHSLNDLHQIIESSTKKRVSSEAMEETTITLSHKEIEELEAAMNQTIDKLTYEEESYLPILGTSASVSPLIGLFGTIWGLIHAFIDISQEKSADIATVAPGMAEALIVTLAGLIVAIPALVAYHYFTNQVRKFENQLCEVGDKFLYAAKQKFVK
jgi:biopolymer transport protein TolQ